MSEQSKYQRYMDVVRDNIRHNDHFPRIRDASIYCTDVVGEYYSDSGDELTDVCGFTNYTEVLERAGVEAISHAHVQFGNFADSDEFVAVPWVLAPDGVVTKIDGPDLMHGHLAGDCYEYLKDGKFEFSRQNPTYLRAFCAARPGQKALFLIDLYTKYNDIPNIGKEALDVMGTELAPVAKVIAKFYTGDLPVIKLN